MIYDPEKMKFVVVVMDWVVVMLSHWWFFLDRLFLCVVRGCQHRHGLLGVDSVLGFTFWWQRRAVAYLAMRWCYFGFSCYC